MWSLLARLIADNARTKGAKDKKKRKSKGRKDFRDSPSDSLLGRRAPKETKASRTGVESDYLNDALSEKSMAAYESDFKEKVAAFKHESPKKPLASRKYSSDAYGEGNSSFPSYAETQAAKRKAKKKK